MLAGSLFGLVVAVSPLARSDLATLLVAVFVLLALAAVLSVVWREMAAAPTRADRARITYVLVGAVIVGSLAFLDFLPRLGVRYPLEGLGFMAPPPPSFRMCAMIFGTSASYSSSVYCLLRMQKECFFMPLHPKRW